MVQRGKALQFLPYFSVTLSLLSVFFPVSPPPADSVGGMALSPWSTARLFQQFPCYYRFMINFSVIHKRGVIHVLPLGTPHL